MHSLRPGRAQSPHQPHCCPPGLQRRASLGCVPCCPGPFVMPYVPDDPSGASPPFAGPGCPAATHAALPHADP
eukprot:2399136-Alexandrium_andersonii.AAC.1